MAEYLGSWILEHPIIFGVAAVLLLVWSEAARRVHEEPKRER